MKWSSALVPVLILLAASATAQKIPDPIIDMHLHAIRADANGPPPLALCSPPDEYPLLDPKDAWPNTFTAWMKNPKCANPIWSPLKDEDVMTQSIEILKRRNIIAVASGPPLDR